jgi:proteasome lid subunit RPN8/RPN11
VIVIGHAQLRQIMDAAEAAYPNECCGLLVGHRQPNGVVEVTRVHPSANLRPQRDRFEIDPRLWVDLARALGKGPHQVVGLYHSHPDGPAQPSAVDLQAAWGEELVWLIVAVTAAGEGAAQAGQTGGQAVHVTAHILDHGGRQFRPLVLRTPDWKPYPVRDPADDPTTGAKDGG